MRVFIAIDLDEQVRKALGELQRNLCAKTDLNEKDVKWVDPEIMHLTLKFLGEIKDAELAEVCRTAGQVADRHQGFELQIQSVGTFGGKSPRVLWVGTGQGSEPLAKLQKDLETALGKLGFGQEKRQFTGHLTLCRIKNPKAGAELAKAAKEYCDAKLGISFVDAVTVYQSQLTGQGPIYTAMGNYKLQ